MTRPPISATLTVAFANDAPDDLEQTIGATLADRTAGRILATSRDEHGRHLTWQLAVDGERTIGWWSSRIHDALVDALPPANPYEVLGCELITMEEAQRRLAAHGVPASGQAGSRADRAPLDIPEVVTTTEFAALCGRTPQRIRQLRAERADLAARDALPADHPFPAEVFPGHWRRGDAEQYAARLAS